MCFTLIWLRDLFIWAICIGAIIAIIKLLIPMVMAQFPQLVAILNIVLWAIVCILVVYIAFDLISCLLGSSGFRPPSLTHAR